MSVIFIMLLLSAIVVVTSGASLKRKRDAQRAAERTELEAAEPSPRKRGVK